LKLRQETFLEIFRQILVRIKAEGQRKGTTLVLRKREWDIDQLKKFEKFATIEKAYTLSVKKK